jgi:hypothetical protein
MSREVFAFILQELHARYPGAWLIVPRGEPKGRGEVIAELEALNCPLTPRLRERLAKTESLSALMKNFSLKGVRLDSHMGMLGWLEGRYPLELRYDIPTPGEMLDIQCEGRRFVSLLKNPEEKYRAIGRHAGAYEFLLHDLEHAHKFFGDPFLLRAQIAFFRFLKAKIPAFSPWMDDPLFMKDLHYLMSDMNSHPVHLFKYLKAVVLTAALRKDSSKSRELDRFWLEILKPWPESALEAALIINHPEVETEDDRVRVAGFFTSAEL